MKDYRARIRLLYSKPMGLGTYKVTQERLRELLPPEEEMKRLMEEDV